MPSCWDKLLLPLDHLRLRCWACHCPLFSTGMQSSGYWQERDDGEAEFRSRQSQSRCRNQHILRPRSALQAEVACNEVQDNSKIQKTSSEALLHIYILYVPGS